MRLHKVLNVLLAAVLFLAILPISIKAAETPYVQVVASKTNPAIGEVVTFSVNLKNFNEPSNNLSSFEVKLGFDSSYWETVADKVDFGDYIQSLQASQYEMPMNNVSGTNGTVHMALSIYKNDAVTYFSGDGTLFTFSLKPKKNGATDVNITKSLFVQISKPGLNVSHGKVDASINIGGSSPLPPSTPPVDPAPPAPPTTPPPPSPPADNGGSPGQKFVDDKEISPYAYEAVYKVQELGIMSGLSSEPRFGPSQALTRAQFTKIIVNMLGEKPTTGKNSKQFKDVPVGNWAHGYVMKAVELGIIKGITADTFNPSATITREQVALMIGRAYKMKPIQNAITFKDQGKINKEALPYIQALQQQKIIMGSNGYFNPKQTVTREMAAVIAVRVIEKN
jgi:hypothetical protein